MSMNHQDNHSVKSVTFTGWGAVVYDRELARELWDLGNFGKGSLSRSKPVFKSRVEAVLEGMNDPESYRLARRGGTPLLRPFAADADDEFVQLSCEELVYLAVELGVINVQDFPNSTLIWNQIIFNLCSKDSRAIANCMVYRLYRNRGWVVRSGLKYGADFLLYADKVEKTHAAHAVLVSFGTATDQPEMNWINLIQSVRVLSQVHKNLILCSVALPNIPLNSSYNIYCDRCTISESQFGRFLPR